MRATTLTTMIGLLVVAASAGAFAQISDVELDGRSLQRDKGTRPNDLYITVSPHNPPVSIPDAGGNFDFTIGLGNNESLPAGFEVWTMLEMPDGTLEGPIHGPSEFLLPSNWSAANELSSLLAPDAPAGPYTFYTYLGQFPYSVWASAMFAFEKAEFTPPWYPQTSGTSNFLFSVQFVDENHGWATGMLNTILHTSDGGDNWYPQPIPPSSHYQALHFLNTLEGWAVGDSGKIAHTEDGGESWTLQPSGTSYYLYDVQFLDENTGYVVGGIFPSFSPGRQLIKKTTDGGETWVTVFSQSYVSPLKGVHFVDVNRGWAVGEGGAVLHTSDGGETWTEQDTPTNYHLEEVFFTNATHGWAAGVNGTLYRTTDGGATWEQGNIASAAHFTDIMFTDPQNGWISGGDGPYGGVVFRTSDGGATWVAQEVTDAQSLAGLFFLDANNGWAVGFDGTIVRTRTGGE